MDSHWVGHMLESDDGNAVCTFDIGLASSCPDDRRPLFTFVRVPFKEQADHGFGSDEERSKLGDLEEAMEERGAEHMAVHFATLRYGGVLDVLFYSPADAGKQLEALARDVFCGYELEVGSKDDAEWGLYQKLFPPPEAIAESQDMQIFQALESAGDVSSKPRPVAHMLILPDQASADAAAGRAGALGFAEMERYEDSGEELAITLQLTKTHDIQPETVAGVRAELTALAEELGGEYDGWETPVVK